MIKIIVVYLLAVTFLAAQVPVIRPYPIVSVLSNIKNAEVFVGITDPGIGQATPITIPTGSTNPTATNVTVNFTALPNGIQYLYVRTQDVLGKWSLTSYKMFVVGNFNYPTIPALNNVSSAEVYAGNTDPGIGQATPLPIPTGSTNPTATNTTINFSALPNGAQYLYLRTKDAAGKWSLTNYKMFIVDNFNYPASPTLNNLSRAEFFVGNTDPGFGQAIPIVIPANLTDATLSNVTVNFPVQPDGLNSIYIRSKDVAGRWSLTNDQSFNIGPLSVEDFDIEHLIVYPNPFNEILSIKYDKPIAKISVFNLLGKEVLTKLDNGLESKIDFTGLQQGTYFVKLTSDKAISSIKVIKN
jgi:hypothetical protein